MAQTPKPDPAPVPAPPPPVIEPAPEPPAESVAEPSPLPTPTPEPKTEKKRPERPLVLRMDRLHPPLAQEVPYAQPRAARADDLAALSGVRLPASGSDSLPIAVLLLLALAGLIVTGFVVLVALPERLLGGAPLLADHRGELAFGGFAVLLGLAVGVVIPLLLP